jgi:hypothetical protein
MGSTPFSLFVILTLSSLVLIIGASGANGELAPINPDFDDLPAIIPPLVRTLKSTSLHALTNRRPRTTSDALTPSIIMGTVTRDKRSIGSSRRLQTASNGTNTTNTETGKGFVHAFVAALSIILVSEIGDKTFFIAAIMAMRHPRSTVFLGASAALFLMTALSGTRIGLSSFLFRGDVCIEKYCSIF